MYSIVFVEIVIFKKIENVLDNIIIGNGFILSYKVGIFDLLYKIRTGMSINDIQQNLNIHTRPLKALLSVCCYLKFISSKKEKFYLTKLAIDTLFDKGQEYYRDILDLILENKSVIDLNFSATHLREDINLSLTQKPSLFIDIVLDTERAKKFIDSMHNKSISTAQAISMQVNLNEYTSLLDIGGCSGIFAYEFCKKFTNLSSIVFDLPNICNIVKYKYKKHFDARVTLLPGDMWQDDYPNSEVHLYSDIIHDWPKEKSILLLQKSYKSLPLNGKIIINEKLLNNKKTGPKESVVYNLKMLFWTEGYQYSAKEIYTMLKSVGFNNITIFNYYGAWSVIEGYKNSH